MSTTIGIGLALVATALTVRWLRVRREKRRVACYFSHITGNKSEDFLRVINGERFEDVFGKDEK